MLHSSEQQQQTPTPSPTTTPTTLRSNASIKARERLNQINNIANPTTLELDEALKLYNLIEDIETPDVRNPWRLYFDETKETTVPTTSPSTPDEFFEVRGFTPEEMKKYEFELGFDSIQNRTGLDVIEEEKIPKSKKQITKEDYSDYIPPSTASSSGSSIREQLRPKMLPQQFCEFSC